MGIHDFTNIFTKHTVITFKNIAGKRVAVDSYNEIFRTSGTQHKSQLTNARGEPTAHIKSILSNLTKAQELKLNQIWVFDSRKSRVEKAETISDRKDVKQAHADKITALAAEIASLEQMSAKLNANDIKTIDPDFINTMAAKKELLSKLNSQNPTGKQFCKFREDVKFILDCLGIQWCIAPDGIDAEQYGAWLCELKLADGVITTDPDALLAGAPFIVKKIPGKAGKYEQWILQDILDEHKITRDQLIEIGVAMGCDFAPKVSGIGAKTVVAKVKSGGIKWTDKQKMAIAIFKEHPPSDKPPAIKTPVRSQASMTKLHDWLIKEQQFGVAGVVKQLRTFGFIP